MAKHQPTDTLADALRKLELDPATAPEHALEAIRSIRARSIATDAAIAHALGLIQIEGAAQLLAEMEPASTGATRREIRRALFKLRQRGFEAAPAPSPVKPIGPTATTGADSLRALMSPIDPEGARLVWIIKARPQGGSARLWGLTSESEGLVGATMVNLSGRQLREERSELERRAGLALVDADWRLADFIVCEAYRRTPEGRRGQVGNFLTIRAEIIASPPPVDFAHPIYDELAAECAAEPSLDLLKEPEIAEWRLPAEKTRSYIDEVNDIRQSPLVLNRFQQEDRINTIVERAIGELLSGENGIDCATPPRRYRVLSRPRRPASGGGMGGIGGDADARPCRFEANPVFPEFRPRQPRRDTRRAGRAQRDEPRLIVTPAEVMRERQASAAARARRCALAYLIASGFSGLPTAPVKRAAVRRRSRCSGRPACNPPPALRTEKSRPAPGRDRESRSDGTASWSSSISDGCTSTVTLSTAMHEICFS